ncbi:Hpt domain-containing protein [Anaerotruncus rubiinfantis]|uniref:Hpt domain-containing protein n=1 Tax=Anaerotruncus rubiinfantis TaxID=1720200 RepID=UPI00082E2E72|nr:Hpt domain-containing protein [Anaerotruncus rubiinfantis]
MRGFREAFEAYGADYGATMARFMGSETMYLRLLDMLFQDKNLQKLGDAVASGDLRGAFEAAHTLKGVAGNMGLTPLYDAVCAMVEPLRTGQQCADYPVLYQVVQEEFQRAKIFRDDLKRTVE